MRRAFRSFLWCFGGVLLASLSGCGGGGTTTTFSVLSTPKRVGNLEFTVSATRASYPPGKPIPLTFTVKNVGAEAVTIASSTASIFQIRVQQGSGVIWYMPPFRYGVSPPGTTLTLTPGEMKSFTLSWDQTVISHANVPGGAYTITGSLLANTINDVRPAAGESLDTGPIQIWINGPCVGDPAYAVPGEVLVGVQADKDGESESAFLSRYGSITYYFSDFHSYSIKLRPGLCVMEAITLLKPRPEIAYAEPNWLFYGGGGGSRAAK